MFLFLLIILIGHLIQKQLSIWTFNSDTRRVGPVDNGKYVNWRTFTVSFTTGIQI